MNTDTVNLILTLAFIAIVGAFAIVSIIAMFVLVKYGRSKSISLFSSLVFTALFVLQAVAAFVTLRSVL